MTPWGEPDLRATLNMMQANLIVGPPNGMLPALTPEGKRRAWEMGSDWALPGEDIDFQSAADFDRWDRCVTRGLPSMMMPYRCNGGFRIEQAPGYAIFDIETTNFGVDPLVNLPMIELAVVGSPPGNRFPISDQMKTTERITRLNHDTWLYEITTEDPVILSAPFTVRYPMHDDPSYWWFEYACHEGNTIVRNYTETNRYGRANRTPEAPEPPVEVSASVADALVGRWVGRPRIATIDVDIELEFTRSADGMNLGEIDKLLREIAIDERRVRYTFPNVDPCSVNVELREDGHRFQCPRRDAGRFQADFAPMSLG